MDKMLNTPSCAERHKGKNLEIQTTEVNKSAAHTPTIFEQYTKICVYLQTEVRYTNPAITSAPT